MLVTAAGDCARRVAGRHVLAIQDTSEINFQAHAGRVKGLGPVGNGTDLGFFIHPALAVDGAEHGGIIGLAGGVVWRRQGKIETGRRQRDLADKESRRWIEVARESAAMLQAADLVTVMGDRESGRLRRPCAARAASSLGALRTGGAAQERMENCVTHHAG